MIAKQFPIILNSNALINEYDVISEQHLGVWFPLKIMNHRTEPHLVSPIRKVASFM